MFSGDFSLSGNHSLFSKLVKIRSIEVSKQPLSLNFMSALFSYYFYFVSVFITNINCKDESRLINFYVEMS